MSENAANADPNFDFSPGPESPEPEIPSHEAPDHEVLGASDSAGSDNTQKDPSDWVSGDDPMTGAQKSYLDTLARQAGEELPADLNKAEASQHIDRLKSATQSDS